jgi:hypothetical protein
MASKPLRSSLSEAMSPAIDRLVDRAGEGGVNSMVDCLVDNLMDSLRESIEHVSRVHSSVAAGPMRSERREPRFAMGLPVVICGFSARGRIFSEFAATLDISRSGCCIHLRNRPQRDSTLAMRMTRMGETPGAVMQVLLHVEWMGPHELGLAVGASVLDESDLAAAAFPIRKS